jgi:hypothetical protein
MKITEIITSVNISFVLHNYLNFEKCRRNLSPNPSPSIRLLAQTPPNKGRRFILSGDGEVLASVEEKTAVTRAPGRHVSEARLVILGDVVEWRYSFSTSEFYYCVYFNIILTHSLCLSCGPSPRSYVTFRNMLVSIGELLAPRSTPKLRLYSHYTRMYPPYLESDSYIRNQRTRHNTATTGSLNIR